MGKPLRQGGREARRGGLEAQIMGVSGKRRAKAGAAAEKSAGRPAEDDLAGLVQVDPKKLERLQVVMQQQEHAQNSKRTHVSQGYKTTDIFVASDGEDDDLPDIFNDISTVNESSN